MELDRYRHAPEACQVAQQTGTAFGDGSSLSLRFI
jgi:hypothetical protein